MASRLLFGMLVLLFGLGGAAQAGATLDKVSAAGMLSCGVLMEPDDYGKSDIHGALVDLGSDFCRAVAAAVLGDARKVAFVPLPDEARGSAALQAGQIDLLLGASPASSSALVYGLNFGRDLFLDGEGLLVRDESGIASFQDLAGKQVCFIANTDAETVLNAEARRRDVSLLPFPFEESGEMQTALLTGHCAAIIDSQSRLANLRAGLKRQARSFVVLAKPLSVEPMAPAYRDGDPQWSALVNATAEALLLAEASGLTRDNAAARFQHAEEPLPGGLSGSLPGIDAKLVDRGWVRRVIEAVGNYAEIYARDCGPNSPLALPRGVNALWTDGGLMVAHPLR